MQANAQYNFPAVNRFALRGTYRSAISSEIARNAFNIPEGSVRVTAAVQTLQEGADYTVDYTLDRVKIINQGILEPGTPTNVSLESNSAFGINRKSFFASRFNYKASEDLNFGGTIMNLSERPLTQKVQPDLFQEGASNQYRNDLTFNKNRAHLAWYMINPLFFRDDNTTPQHIRGNHTIQGNHLMRQVFETEVFPKKEFNNAQGLQNFDLGYNYDVNPVPGVTAGVEAEGDTVKLVAPESRWAGIQRRIDQTDFDAAIIEFIQFWMMNPYAEREKEGFPGNSHSDRALYFNIGNISEDALKDEVKSFENGFPTNEQGASAIGSDSERTADRQYLL